MTVTTINPRCEGNAQISSTRTKSGTEKLAMRLVDLAINEPRLIGRAAAEIRDPSMLAKLYLKATEAVAGAGDRAGAALGLISHQFLFEKTPWEIIDSFVDTANELRPQVDLCAEQF